MIKKVYSLQCLAVYSILFLLLLLTLHCSLYTMVYAKEVTILYTGETHAMLYPCNCPKEPDGGVARRATLIKQLKKSNPNTLVLDSGGFFAGGLMDEYTQNVELDKERTKVALKAMQLMPYDALALGDDEFNFGREFLETNIDKTNLTFLSCNISATNRGGSANNLGGKSDKIRPYIIKEVGGNKIGIIGVTNLLAMQKAGGLRFIEPKLAVKEAVEELKKKGTNVIVLLSHLGENDDLRLIEEIEGIDILIVGHSRGKEEASGKIASTLILRPSWQGRRLGKLSFKVLNNKIADYKVEELRLSDKIRDDPEILKILPACFSNVNCKNKGLIGICKDGGTEDANCLFSKPSKVGLLIITPKLCNVCNSQPTVDYLKKQFPGLVSSYLYYPDSKSEKLVRDLDIKGLPVYLLGKDVAGEEGFAVLKEHLEIKGDFYMAKPQWGGISYFLNRKESKGKLDLFISLYDKNSKELLGVMKGFNPIVHFLAIEPERDKLDAARGNLEVEEYLRAVCVQKYYPQKFWDYIGCRAENINSSWWEDCLGDFNVDKIKICAKGEEARALLKENISLNKELGVIFGPTYLLDNQEVFGTQGVPTKEEFKKIIGG